MSPWQLLKTADAVALIVAALRDADKLLQANSCNCAAGMAAEEDFRREVILAAVIFFLPTSQTVLTRHFFIFAAECAEWTAGLAEPGAVCRDGRAQGSRPSHSESRGRPGCVDSIHVARVSQLLCELDS